MVVVFSHIDFFDGENLILTQLFESGLDKLHIKKLGNIAQWRGLLTGIPEKFRKKVVVHSNYELKNEFPEIQLHSGKAMESEERFVSSSAHSLSIKSDYKSFLSLNQEQFDIIFADPPFDMPGVEEIPDLIFNSNCLTKIGTLIVEHSDRIDFSSHPKFVDLRKYGGVNFSFFEVE